jgi:hypothetical protein
MNKQTIFEGREHGYTVLLFKGTNLQKEKEIKGPIYSTVKQEKVPCLALQLHIICKSVCEVFTQMSPKKFLYVCLSIFTLLFLRGIFDY